MQKRDFAMSLAVSIHSPFYLDEANRIREEQERMQLAKEELLYTLKKTAQVKLTYQLHEALNDPCGRQKFYKKAFRVDSTSLPSSLKPPFNSIGAASFQGNEPKMEDGFLLQEKEEGFSLQTKVRFRWKEKEESALLFGVFDGMGDGGKTASFASSFLGNRLGKVLSQTCQETPYVNEEAVTHSLTQAFHQLSTAYREKGEAAGASATFVFLHKNQIYCPNIGLCRTILVKGGKAFQLTEDALPSKERFKRWHKKHQNVIQGSCVQSSHSSESTPTARALGAYDWMCLRPKITSLTQARQEDRLAHGQLFCYTGDYLVLATPQFFRCATNEEVAQAVDGLAKKGAPPLQIAQKLVATAMSYPDIGNVSVLVFAV